MLYVAKFVGKNGYAIVDTDDNTEEVVSRGMLESLVCRLDLDIKGVDVAIADRSKQGKYKYIKSINIYRVPGQSDRRLTKLLVMQGLSVNVLNGQITSVLADARVVGGGVTVRLSDFGSSCSDFLFRGMDTLTYNRLFTVVLDEKIKLSKDSLTGCFDSGVAIDFREVASVKTLDFIAKAAVDGIKTIDELLHLNMLIGKPADIDYMKAFVLVNAGVDVSRNVFSVRDVVSPENVQGVNDRISSKYTNEFRSLANLIFIKNVHKKNIPNYNKFVTWLVSDSVALRQLEDKQFAVYRNGRFLDIFDVMIEYSAHDKYALSRFRNYIKYFDVQPKIADYFVSFVYRACKWCLSSESISS